MIVTFLFLACLNSQLLPSLDKKNDPAEKNHILEYCFKNIGKRMGKKIYLKNLGTLDKSIEYEAS